MPMLKCNRCEKFGGPSFVSEGEMEAYKNGTLIAGQEIDCLTCDGSGEVDHECDCPKCNSTDPDDCPECDGKGTTIVEERKQIGHYFHVTMLGRIYCLKCVNEMIAATKPIRMEV